MGRESLPVGDRSDSAIAIGPQQSHACLFVTFNYILRGMPERSCAAAQRAGKVDLLAREIAAQIKCCRIEEIARWTRFRQRFDAIARAKFLRIGG